MSLLLDTHVVLWWLMDDDELSPEIKDAIDTEAEVYLSAATVWEIAIKAALGKIAGPDNLLELVTGSGLIELPVRSRHVIDAASLPMIHRDPFDRVLIAQARCEGLTLLSRDPWVHRYDVAVQMV